MDGAARVVGVVHLRVRPAGIALVAMFLVGSCGDTEPTEPDAVSRDLFNASLTAVANEVWVYGGVSAPVGTAPPVTSVLPPGWEANRDVTVYDVDGTVSRRFMLEVDRALVGGRVFASEGSHYLLGSLCDGSMGCGTSVEPALFRFGESGVERMHLEVTPLDPDDASRVLPPLYAFGQTGGMIWALQGVESTGLSSPEDLQHGLLAIELASGTVTEVELDGGMHGPGSICVSTDSIIRIDPTFDERGGRLREARLVSRPATAGPAAWETLTVLPFAGEHVFYGGLTCLTDQDQLVMTYGQTDSHIITLSMSNGEETEPRVVLPGALVQHLGTVDDAAVVESFIGEPALWRHPPGGPWQVVPEVDLDGAARPVVINDGLYDAQHLVEQSGVNVAELVPLGT